MTGNPKYRRLVVFGRRQGHRLRPQRQALMRDLLPQIGIDLTPDGDPIQPRDLFADGTKEVWLEIGFGAGEHLAWQAARRPEDEAQRPVEDAVSQRCFRPPQSDRQ